MTRLAVLADIHGNLPALEAVMADMRQYQPDQVVVAGDVINWGPFSAAVTEIVTRQGWGVIRGNAEYYLLDYDTPRQPTQWSRYTLLPWLYEQLKGRWHSQIATWADTISLRFRDAPPILMVHGIPDNPWVTIHPLTTDEQAQAMLEGVDESFVITGHSHLALSRHVGRWHVINPGSVGVPLDGIPCIASYAILDGSPAGWTPLFRRIPFDATALFAEYERQGFGERVGIAEQLVVDEFRTARVLVHAFNGWKKTLDAMDIPEADLLSRFWALDKWAYIPPEYHLNMEPPLQG